MSNTSGLSFRARLIGSTALLALCAGAANAQDNGDIEQVVVSASRITIAGYTQPTPVTVVGAAQLDRTPIATSRIIRNLPQVNSRRPPTAPLQAAARRLRRQLCQSAQPRLHPYPGSIRRPACGGIQPSPAAWTSHLPNAMVSRVDIVTGGASAAWGSDAVAGVVNFVLNKNFTGFKATSRGATRPTVSIAA